MRTAFSATLAAVLLATATHAQTVADLAGKTLVMGAASFTLARNGAMTGTTGKDPIDATWTVRDGKFCRTIRAPKQLAGTQCQSFEIKGGKVTFRRADGATQVYDIK